MQVEIDSPPYPTPNCSDERLYQLLADLRGWLVAMIPQLADEGCVVQGTVGPLLHTNAFRMMSVPDKYAVWVMMRRVREDWDRLLREYEDRWDNMKAVAERGFAVVAAIEAFNWLMLDQETREARVEAHRMRIRRRRAKLRAYLDKEETGEASGAT